MTAQALLLAPSVSFWQRRCAPVDNSPLVLFRVVFGLLLVAEAGGAILTGWVRRTFIEPKFTFTVIGLEWWQPLPGDGMYYYFGLMALCGVGVTLGYRYKWAIGGYTLLWTGAYVMQKTSYNNHYYLLILLCGLMWLMPAHGAFSLDARRRGVQARTCPRWCGEVLILQLGIVYTYAAIAKIYPDWLEARPLDIWFAARAHYPVLGPWLQLGWVKQLVAYGGIAFDLTIVPLLLWGRTRWLAVGLSAGFHLFNSLVFHIGIFPYLMLGMLLFFFPAEAVRRRFFPRRPPVEAVRVPPTLTTPQRALGWFFLLYFAIQVYLPLRHWFYPGDVHWTEEGHRLAWQMMLRSKSGTSHFEIEDPQTGQRTRVQPRDFLTPKQARSMAVRPDMTWQFAQYLRRHHAQQGQPGVRVYAYNQVSLNGRPAEPLVDSQVNLADVPWERFGTAEWITPGPTRLK